MRILVTTLHGREAKANVIDSFATREGDHKHPYHQILHIVESVHCSMQLHARVAPRFDFGALKP